MSARDPLAQWTITVIRSRQAVNKRYYLQPGGVLTKDAKAVITSGIAQSRIIRTSDEMAALLNEVTRSNNMVIVPGRWHGDNGTPFEILTKAALAEMCGECEDDCPTGVIEIQGRRVAARLAAGIDPSSWILLDADSPAGMPPEWAAMSIEKRLNAWEAFAPGLSRVEAVGLRASSARVRKEGASAGEWTHLWLRIDEPANISHFRLHCDIEMVRHGWSFKSPKYSRIDGRVVGHATRGLFDMSVLHTGRIVFYAQPDIRDAPGFVLDDADIGILNGTSELDTSFAKKPDVSALKDYREKTGTGLSIKIGKGGGLSTTNRGILSLDTEIEVKRVIKPLREWIDTMTRGNKLRCEAPFRESSSEAAFIRIGDDGQPFIHDSGTSTTYRLSSPVDDLVEELNERYMVVNETGRAVVYELVHDPIQNRRVYVPFTFEDFKKLHLNRRIQIGHKPNFEAKWMDAGTCWLKHSDRRQYTGGIVFDPSSKQDRPDILNLWQGFAVESRLGGSWAKLRDHILTIICNGDRSHYGYLLGWLARLVQYPAQQGEVAVILRGGEGAGKGTLANAIRQLFGAHAIAVSNSEHLVGRFNGHLRDVVFLFADEAFYAGNKAHIGVLKSIITEPRLSLEAKYKNPIEAPNFIHLMMASNEKWVIPASVGSRRFFCLDVSPARANDHSYFGAIRAELESGGYESMLYDLLHHDLTTFNIREVPQTTALNDQRLLSLDSATGWWRDALSEGRVGVESHFAADWEEHYSTAVLYAAYLEYARARHEYRPMDRTQLGEFLESMGGRKMRPHARPRGYTFGTLAEARQAFCRKTCLDVQWPE